MQKIIRLTAMFALGFAGVWVLKQVGITPKGEDGEINWLVAVAMMVTAFVIAALLDKPLKKLTGEINEAAAKEE